MLQDHEIKALILDPFARAFSGCGNENDNGEVAAFTDALDEIKKQANVPDLFLTHHFGRKEQERGDEHGRGATRLDDWADSRWLLTKEASHRFLRVDGRGVSLEETRLIWEPSGQLRIGPGSRQEARTESALTTLNNVLERVVSVVANNPGVNTRGIQSALSGTSHTVVGKAIKSAIGDGRLTAENGPGNSKRHYVCTAKLDGVP